MALSRRNVLIALGAAVGGGGALVGTGAFTTVSAERSVEVSTAGDANAFLTITSDSPYVPAAANGDTLTIDLSGQDNASGFNDNAITTITDVVAITNNAPDNADNPETDVGLSTAAPGSADLGSGSGSAPLVYNDQSSNGFGYFDVTFYLDTDAGDSSLSSNTPTLGIGETAYLDVEVDTTVDYSDSNPETDDSLTIVAN